MSIESAFYSLLNNNANITNFFNDIEPHKRKGPLPMLTYRFISYPGNYLAGVKYPRVQLDVWGNTYAESKEGRAIVYDELQDWRGDMSGFAVKNIVIMSELEAHNSDLDIYRQIMDFKIIYQE